MLELDYRLHRAVGVEDRDDLGGALGDDLALLVALDGDGLDQVLEWLDAHASLLSLMRDEGRSGKERH